MARGVEQHGTGGQPRLAAPIGPRRDAGDGRRCVERELPRARLRRGEVPSCGPDHVQVEAVRAHRPGQLVAQVGVGDVHVVVDARSIHVRRARDLPDLRAQALDAVHVREARPVGVRATQRVLRIDDQVVAGVGEQHRMPEQVHGAIGQSVGVEVESGERRAPQSEAHLQHPGAEDDLFGPDDGGQAIRQLPGAHLAHGEIGVPLVQEGHRRRAIDHHREVRQVPRRPPVVDPAAPDLHAQRGGTGPVAVQPADRPAVKRRIGDLRQVARLVGQPPGRAVPGVDAHVPDLVHLLAAAAVEVAAGRPDADAHRALAPRKAHRVNVHRAPLRRAVLVGERRGPDRVRPRQADDVAHGTLLTCLFPRPGDPRRCAAGRGGTRRPGGCSR